VNPMPRPVPSDRSQGHLPAYGRRAVPTREYQCGGQPIHPDPARRPTPGAARSPPDRARTQTPASTTLSARPATALSAQMLTCLKPVPSTRHEHRLDKPFHIRVQKPGRHAALPFSSCPGWSVAGSGDAGGVGMVFMLAALDGSGRRSPCPAALPGPLIRLCDPSLCRARPARKGSVDLAAVSGRSR
jgi:hypothetical protein